MYVTLWLWVKFQLGKPAIAFNWLSTQMETLLSFADYGALFVFGGESGDISSFAFGVLPIIVYFSMIVSILYYIGFMPYFIGKVIDQH